MSPTPVSLANELLKDCGRTLPVDVESLALAHGLKLEYLDLDSDVSGFLLFQNGGTVLGVNKDQHPNRQRFTIAHELGHYLLHQEHAMSNYYTDKGVVFFRDDTTSFGTDDFEKEANSFAAALLMPAKEIKEKVLTPVRPTDETRIRQLASDFGVSQLAMTFRLTNLKLVQPF